MRKMLLDGDSIVIDGKEFTKEELKQALIEQHKFHKLTDFLETKFKNNGGVTSEH